MKRLASAAILCLLLASCGPPQNGQGTYEYDDGTYAGEFKGGRPDGRGIYTYATGHKYVGEWKDGKEHGQGTVTSTYGDKYVGEYKDGKKHGQGTFTLAGGSKYVGEYKDGKKHGQGIYTWSSGDKYVGEYKADKRHGQGTKTWADSATYIGEWRSGKEWEGVQYLVSGDVGGIYVVGEFCEGCLEQALPHNGAVNSSLTGERIATLKVNTKGESHYLVKLAPFHSANVGMTIVIHAGESIETKVPLGSYEFRYASGQKWYGYENRFGPTTAYYKGEGVMNFTKERTANGYSILGHEVTLYTVSDGNYQTEAIDEKNF